MNTLPKAIAGGLLGGMLGAVLWMLVAHLTGYEVGIVAWLIGFLSGLGVMIGSRAVGGRGHGVLAAIIAVACVIGGKLGAVSLALDRIEREELVVTEADAVDELAGDIVDEMAEAGTLTDADWESAAEDEFYPASVTAAAQARWDGMGPTEREVFMHERTERHRAHLNEHRGVATALYFLISFGLWGFLWLGLATVSAYKLGAARRGREDAAAPATVRVAFEAGAGAARLLGPQPAAKPSLSADAQPASTPPRPRFTMTGEPVVDEASAPSREAA